MSYFGGPTGNWVHVYHLLNHVWGGSTGIIRGSLTPGDPVADGAVTQTAGATISVAPFDGFVSGSPVQLKVAATLVMPNDAVTYKIEYVQGTGVQRVADWTAGGIALATASWNGVTMTLVDSRDYV